MKKADLHADCIYIATFKNTGAKYFVTGGLVSYCQFDNPKTINSNFTDNYGNYSYESASVSDAKWFKACIKEGKILPKVLTKKDLNPELIYVATGENKYFVKGDLSHYTSNKNLGLTKNFLDSGGYTYELASSTDTRWFNETLYGVDNQSKDFKVAAGSYIVVLKLNSTGSRCAKEDYIFKQRETLDHIAPCVDLDGSNTNANTTLLFNRSDILADWRYATDKEVELYESVGKPCSIHDVKPTIPEYVECTFAASSSLTVGGVYKVGSDGYVIDNQNRCSWAYWGNTNTSQFKPSTKEAYDNQSKEQYIDEILEICKQKYPIGTEIISTMGSEAIVETEPYIGPMGNTISVNKNSKILYDFDTKKYAKIVGSASNIEPKDVTFHKKPITLQKTKPSDDLEFQQANIIKTKQKKNKLITINQ